MEKEQPKTKVPGISSRNKTPVAIPTGNRITLFTRDQEGSIYGVVSLHRDNILDVTYNAINHEMQLTIAGTVWTGSSYYEPMQNMKVENGHKKPLGSYTMQMIYQEQGYNPSMTLRDEAEMEKVWKWLQHDQTEMSWEAMKEIRKNIIARIAKAKEEQKKKDEEAKKKQEEEILNKAPKIVDQNGAPMESHASKEG